MIKNQNSIEQNKEKKLIEEENRIKLSGKKEIDEYFTIFLDESNILDNIKKFYENLRKMHEKKLIVNQQHSKFYEKLEKNENLYFEYEDGITRSVFTILQGPWGSGKTHFMNKFIEYWSENSQKNEFNYFSQLISINAIKYSSSNDVSAAIISTILFHILKTNKNFSTKIINALKYISFGISETILELAFRKIYKLMNNVKKWKENNYETELEKLLNESTNMEKIIEYVNDRRYNNKNQNNKNSNILLFIDNLERLGKDAWKIIRVINALTIFENVIFVLLVNKEKIYGFESMKIYKYNDIEFDIDKFITGEKFEYKNNYINLLSKLIKESKIIIEIDEEEKKKRIEMMNDILSSKINNKILSKRQIARKFNSIQINKLFGRNNFEFLYIFCSDVWCPNTLIAMYIEEIDIRNCLFQKEMLSQFKISNTHNLSYSMSEIDDIKNISCFENVKSMYRIHKIFKYLLQKTLIWNFISKLENLFSSVREYLFEYNDITRNYKFKKYFKIEGNTKPQIIINFIELLKNNFFFGCFYFYYDGYDLNYKQTNLIFSISEQIKISELFNEMDIDEIIKDIFKLIKITREIIDNYEKSCPIKYFVIKITLDILSKFNEKEIIDSIKRFDKILENIFNEDERKTARNFSEKVYWTSKYRDYLYEIEEEKFQAFLEYEEKN